MAVPKAVQKQVRDASELLDQLKNEPVANPDEGEDEGAVEAARAAEQPPAPPAEDDGDYAQKYRVLKGKYDNEIPSLQRQVQEANARLSQMQQLLSQMQSREQEPPRAASARDIVKRITDEEIDEYGADLIDLIGRKAEEVVESRFGELSGKLSKIDKTVGGVSEEISQSRKQKVFTKLDEEVEDWQALNVDPAFLQWLGSPDPFSGIRRGELLTKAFDAADADRVVRFFKSYLNEHAAVQSAATRDSQPGTPKVAADRLVSPGKSRANKTPAGTQDDKRVYTERDVAAFYAAVSRGEYRKNPEEKQRTEEAIFRAMKEGRVVPDNRVPVSNAAY